MRNYQLDEITTRATLRRQLADHFRRVQTDNPKVIDILLFKGQAEAHEVMAHYTQRHHLVRARRAERACGPGRPWRTHSSADWPARRVRASVRRSRATWRPRPRRPPWPGRPRRSAPSS